MQKRRRARPLIALKIGAASADETSMSAVAYIANTVASHLKRLRVPFIDERSAARQYLIDQDEAAVRKHWGEKAETFLNPPQHLRLHVGELQAWTEQQMSRALGRDLNVALICINPDPGQGTFHWHRDSWIGFRTTTQRRYTYASVVISLGVELLELPIGQIQAVIAHELGHMLQCVDGHHAAADVPFPRSDQRTLEWGLYTTSGSCTSAAALASMDSDAGTIAFLALAVCALATAAIGYRRAADAIQAREYDADLRSLSFGGNAEDLIAFLRWSHGRGNASRVHQRVFQAYERRTYRVHPAYRRRVRAIRRAAKHIRAQV